MTNETHNVDLTAHDLELIEQALHTQQKILSVQSRAGGTSAKTRLDNLKNLMGRLERQTPRPNAGAVQGWNRITRAIFC